MTDSPYEAATDSTKYAHMDLIPRSAIKAWQELTWMPTPTTKPEQHAPFAHLILLLVLVYFIPVWNTVLSLSLSGRGWAGCGGWGSSARMGEERSCRNHRARRFPRLTARTSAWVFSTSLFEEAPSCLVCAIVWAWQIWPFLAVSPRRFMVCVQ